jgi:hypothetical protein
MKDGSIEDNQITASSEWDSNHGPNNARLDRPAGGGRTGAWSAKTNDINQWIQVDFGKLRSVSGIVSQGRSDRDQFRHFRTACALGGPDKSNGDEPVPH